MEPEAPVQGAAKRKSWTRVGKTFFHCLPLSPFQVSILKESFEKRSLLSLPLVHPERVS
jgi:hypothetical protein